MRLPIRVTQFPQFAGSVLRRAMLPSREAATRSTFRLCYFMCRSYFPYLYCSIHSLSRLAVEDQIEIYVFCDRNEMLTDEQIRRLGTLGFPVKVIPWEKSQGWGHAQIQNIWNAYSHAAKDAPPNTYVARVDADVFFFSGWIFDAVARSGDDMVGDGHYVNFEYCQGGLYFLKADAVGRILQTTPIETFPNVLSAANINVEDIAAHHIAQRAGLRIWLAFFMMFPDEYDNAGGLTPYQRRKFACLHYAKRNKAPMLDIYLDQVVPESERKGFETALAA